MKWQRPCTSKPSPIARNARPTILLREGRCESRRIVKHTLANLTPWCWPDKIDRLRRVLRDEPLVLAAKIGRVISSPPCGHVEAALTVAWPHGSALPEGSWAAGAAVTAAASPPGYEAIWKGYTALMHQADAYQRLIRLAQQKGPDYVYKLLRSDK